MRWKLVGGREPKLVGEREPKLVGGKELKLMGEREGAEADCGISEST